VIQVPDGTVVADQAGLMADLVGDGSRAVVARGGRGGRGNASLASRRNRVPRLDQHFDDGNVLEVTDVGDLDFDRAHRRSKGGSRSLQQDAAQVAQGQAVYAAQCARCHGVNLQGQPNWRERQTNGRLPAPPHDATGHSWHHPDGVLFGITKHGMSDYAPPGYQSDMLAFDGILTDEEIAAVLAYIKSRWPQVIRARQERINGQANQ